MYRVRKGSSSVELEGDEGEMRRKRARAMPPNASLLQKGALNPVSWARELSHESLCHAE
jgi:hypothetical protein